MLNKKHILISIFTIFMSFLFAKEQGNRMFNPELQRELVIISYETYFDLNPHTANYLPEAQVLSSLYEGLFSYDPITLNPQKALVESYTLSEDRLEWTFVLKDKILFSNGDPITAFSVRDSLLALIQNKSAAFSSLLDTVVGAEDLRTLQSNDISSVGIVAQSERILILKLNNPMAHLPQVLCHHAFGVVHTDKNVFSGSYKLISQDTNSLRLEKNTFYWDAQNVAIPSIRIDFSDDVEKNTYLFNIGKADWVFSDIDVGSLFDPRAIRVSQQFGTSYFFFKSEGAFANSTFRNALLSAIPWTELRSEEHIPATTLVLPLPFFPYVEGIEEYNLDKAKKLLEKSGIEGAEIQLTIEIPDYEPSIKKAELLKKVWEELGIQVEVSVVPSTRYSSTVENSTADLFSYNWIGDYADPTAFLELFKGNSTLNESNWKNDEFDSLLLEAAKTSNTEERYKILAQAEKVLLDSGILIPLSHTLSVNIVDSGLSGWHDNPLDIHPYKYLYFDVKKSLNNLAQLEIK